jgi:hypothetical protein
MREPVANRAGQCHPLRDCRRNLDRLVECPRFAAPRRRRDFGHAAEQALLRAAAQQHRPVAASEPVCHTVARRLFWFRDPRRDCIGQARCGCGAAATPRAEDAARPPRRTDRGAEIHQCLREIAGPLLRHHCRGERPEARVCRRKGFRHRIKPRDDPFDIAVDCRGPPVEGDSGNRSRGVGPDPGQRTQRRRVGGEPGAMPLDDGARAGMQVAGARVIAEALPELKYLVERCRGERQHIGPACHESVEIWRHSRYRRLLQHDFAEPHAVRVGSDAGGGAPRQRAAVAVVPEEKRRGIGGA